jgi:DNA-binding response OmpR family regulator
LSIFGSGGGATPDGEASAAPGDAAAPAAIPMPASTGADATAEPAGSGQTVVVASSDRDVCEILARLVEADGYSAVRVTDADEVVGSVLSKQADALVLDAGSANLDLLKDLRSQGTAAASDVRVMMVGTGPASARLAWQQDADAVLTRPFRSTDVAAVVAAMLARSETERRSERAAQLAAIGR